MPSEETGRTDAAGRPLMLVKPEALRPHELNEQLYGPPEANDAYVRTREDIRVNGFRADKAITVTPDYRIICGVTRWAAASELGKRKVPIVVFQATSERTAEMEYERELINDNGGRTKTEVMKVREWRQLLHIERVLSLARMRRGVAGEKDRERAAEAVGKKVGVSYKTILTKVHILDVADAAQEEGDHKKAATLLRLLNANKITQANRVLGGQVEEGGGEAAPKKKKARRNDCPSDFLGYQVRIRSDNEAARNLATEAELDVLITDLQREIDNARERKALLSRQREEGSGEGEGAKNKRAAKK